MDFVAYIDEAGDDGFSMLASGQPTGQSQWLILGAYLVTAEHDRLLPQWRNSILARFPRRQSQTLHFNELKHEQRVAVSAAIADLPGQIALTISNKATLPGTHYAQTFSKKGYLYNYLVRWLLERITTHCQRTAGIGAPCSLRVVFSKRKGMNYQAMRDYLILMRDGRELIRPIRSINWNVLNIDEVEVENHSKRAGLQLADCATSAFFAGLEPNGYGFTEPRYGISLRTKLLRQNSEVLNCGLTPVPSIVASRPNADQQAFFTACRER